MKKIFVFFAAIIVSGLMVSITALYSNQPKTELIIIGGCECVRYTTQEGTTIIHHTNCKFCKARKL